MEMHVSDYLKQISATLRSLSILLEAENELSKEMQTQHPDWEAKPGGACSNST